ncbi:histidine phosphatase family protein, partial [Lactobacillus intestinalis]
MRTIYLVRHGQTLFNVHHKIQGTCDSPLTRLGIEQARAINRYFK